MKTNVESEGNGRHELPQAERLLSEIFAEDFDITEHSGRDMKLLQREVRHAYWRRRTTGVFLAAAALLILGVLSQFFTRKETVRDLATGHSNPVTAQSLIATSKAGSVGSTDKHGPVVKSKNLYLTDDELLGLVNSQQHMQTFCPRER